uniref:tannase/feruloyl esterase family alpha/beta hydrolase n=1 Tax=Altererythrobacter segetis TaxID=1104773 RepID=UPI001409DFF1|nr:tannase/feruloyl esterase family alpha/beta hydrolase [Altererythrobacter segetis]
MVAAPAETAAQQSSIKVAPAPRCSALLKQGRGGVVIQSAELVPAGRLPGRPGAADAGPLLPVHCKVRGVIDPRTGFGGRPFGTGFELRLPVAWNGRFLFQGGGGLDGQAMPAVGNVANSTGEPALARGFAVVSTDSGHSGSLVDATFGLDQQARTDYAYNALDKVTAEAKRIIGEFYGSPPKKSYFLGCSNGGRQALMASQRLPLQFDGIVAGDPAMRFSRIALGEVWNMHVVARIAPRDADGRPIYSKAFSDGDLKLVRQAALRRCDALDNLADGMINDWQHCDFDPAELTCKAGKTDQCLTSGQVGVLRELFEGPRTAGGGHIYGPFTYDTGIASSAWRGMRLGTSETGQANSADATLGLGQFRYYQLTPPDPNFDPLMPFDNDEMLDRIRYTGGIGDADSPLLSTFALSGKMILYNGMADQGMATAMIVDWYNKMLAATGQPGADAVRLFTVPGMLHCGGGEATDQFEMLDAIVDWVEKGTAPDRIVATSKTMPGLSRPLCPYPKVARYSGGDPKSAASFRCTA